VIDPRPYQADFDRAAAELERMRAQENLPKSNWIGQKNARQDYHFRERVRQKGCYLPGHFCGERPRPRQRRVPRSQSRVHAS
jgi:hypothetical protein